MLDSNSAFFKAMVSTGFDTPSQSFCIEIYDGTMPDDAHILANQGALANYNVDELRNSFVGTSLLGAMGFETSIIAEDLGDDNLVVPLSDSVRELVVSKAGTATWFMLYVAVGSIGSGDDPTEVANLKAHQLLVGSVGTLGSGADLELPNAEIALDRDYKCSDINISLV